MKLKNLLIKGGDGVSYENEKPHLRIRILVQLSILLFVIGIMIAGITILIKMGLEDKKQTHNAIYKSVQTGKTKIQTLDVLGYAEDMPFGEETYTEPRLLKQAGFTKDDVRSYDVYFLDKRGIKQNLFVEGVEVYTDKVDHKIMKAYKYKGKYWNAVLYIPKKEAK